MSIDGTTVRFKYGGKWAILKFLTKYQSENMVNYHDDNNRNTLCFKIPLSNGAEIVTHIGILAYLPQTGGEVAIKHSVVLPDVIGDMPKMPDDLSDNSGSSEEDIHKNTITNEELLEKQLQKEVIHDNQDKDDDNKEENETPQEQPKEKEEEAQTDTEVIEEIPERDPSMY